MDGKQFVAFTREDRQWDCRFNVQLSSDLANLVDAIKKDFQNGRLKYVLVGGVEIGTRPYQDDYKIRHVHVAAMFVNRVSKRSILNTWNVKTGNGYYLVPRDRNKPLSGWIDHHKKEFSKVDPTRCVELELGNQPKDHAPPGQSFVKRSDEEKKKKTNEILISLKKLIEQKKEKEAFELYPRTYLMYGEKIKAMVMQTHDKLKSTGHPHIWLYGSPGLGKSAIFNFIYPNYYKKNLYNKFFDLFNPNYHTHVLLEDLDHDAIDRLTLNFVKTICDETGFAVDQKYKTPQVARSTILVTSNFTIDELISHSTETNPNSRTQNKQALHRRFLHIDIRSILYLLGLKLLPKYELNVLKKEGNSDPSKLFIAWDYSIDMPTCEELKPVVYYQQLIKNHYYGTNDDIDGNEADQFEEISIMPPRLGLQPGD
jgi:hypothetical protein